MRDSAPPKRLLDPDYYRLRYQLAAQLMHRQEKTVGWEPHYATALDILYGERLQTEKGHAGADAESEAQELIEDARTTLCFFEQQERTKRWGLFPVKLTIKQQRLRQFLLRTVVPCLEIVIAASRRRGERSGGEAELVPLRRAIEAQQEGPESRRTVSYRVLYNLACYEAGGRAPNRRATMGYLAHALEEAPADRRHELGKWARKDPSFDALREDPAFDELLSRYK
jgi:hypothetical protein